MAKKVGRKKPYTNKGIHRVYCCRCGKLSSQQWQVCSLDNRWFGICNECYILLNEMVLDFMRIQGRKELKRKYRGSK